MINKQFLFLIISTSKTITKILSELKNSVQLKGEELKLRIDEELKKLIDRLEEYERQSKEFLSSNSEKHKWEYIYRIYASLF